MQAPLNQCNSPERMHANLFRKQSSCISSALTNQTDQQH
jgi:hypothetical protein